MRMTYSHIFEIRVKSTKFDEKMMNIVILTKFYMHIIRIFQYFVLFAYYSHILQVYLKLLYFAKLLLLKTCNFYELFVLNNFKQFIRYILCLNTYFCVIPPDFKHLLYLLIYLLLLFMHMHSQRPRGTWQTQKRTRKGKTR